ncbi:uncharacterized protein RHOBADRAFT_10654 [Rhodotorula graminis WP1]|uniref:Uncharacterized protein n=1 Tax=Rhodotorula graminis (strain WP1) TaxID=578459 RepID=A0A194SD30_RHOGW|nr:uncharacterized protein RHOBADRAFT_10654 [Rhodotorula graminis WP1]KPV78492.1 hypothetical protein RHOBADRAFT_10654 [Rhodotorula graminis WP1]
MPGKIDWSTAVVASNYPLWPVFKALHADNLLTVAELALAPLGRVVFLSRHQIMLVRPTLSLSTLSRPISDSSSRAEPRDDDVPEDPRDARVERARVPDGALSRPQALPRGAPRPSPSLPVHEPL